MSRIATVLLLVLGGALGGCAHPGPASVAGGECKFLERPAYVVRGARQYDQDWIDSTIEGGVGACGWQRPAPRPAELDAAPKPAAKAHNKHGLLWKMRQAWPKKKVAPVVATPEPPEPPVAVTPIAEPLPPPPPPAPRRPIDELLGPVQ